MKMHSVILGDGLSTSVCVCAKQHASLNQRGENLKNQ